MKYQTINLPLPSLNLKNDFVFETLQIESKFLKNNPLGDSNVKMNYVLRPVSQTRDLPVVFHLSGYFSNAEHQVNVRSMENNFVQTIVEWSRSKKIKPAVHVFVDAMTSVGGSQFIDSIGCGDYEKYILNEIVEAIQLTYQVTDSWMIIGASSGGYGALSLCSVSGSPFKTIAAIAPDSGFEASILPDMYKAAPYLQEYLSVKKLLKAIKTGSLLKHKKYFSIFNTTAMALCYGQIKKGTIQLPINTEDGTLESSVWRSWLKKDPVHFLKKRTKHLKDKTIYLDVGQFDEFNLQFGTRKIFSILKKSTKKVKLTEFAGGHFKLRARKEYYLKVLLDSK